MAFDYTHFYELTYLESDGNSFIETNFIPFYSLTEMDVLLPSLPGVLTYYLGSLGVNAYYPFTISSANRLGYRYGANVKWSGTDGVTNTRFNVKSYGTSAEQYLDIDDVRILSGTTAFNVNVSNNFLIFGHITQGVKTPSPPIRIYYLKIYDTNNVLAHWFIPAKRKSNNELGMYDSITDTFYGNSGTGNFIGGEIVPHDTNNVKTKINGNWVDGNIFIKSEGEWKKGTPYIKINGTWKEGG